MPPNQVYLLDYVAGNIRSLANALELLGCEVKYIKSPEDVPNAEVRQLKHCLFLVFLSIMKLTLYSD